MSLSKIVVTGRVSKAPEKRFTPNTNTAITEFSIAVESAPRQDGSSDTNFIRVITWRDLAERCASEIKKGDLVAVDGRLQINSYQSSDGQRKRDAEIDASAVENLSQTMSKSTSPEDEERPMAKARTGNAKSPSNPDELDAIFASEEEIPF